MDIIRVSLSHCMCFRAIVWSQSAGTGPWGRTDLDPVGRTACRPAERLHHKLHHLSPDAGLQEHWNQRWAAALSFLSYICEGNWNVLISPLIDNQLFFQQTFTSSRINLATIICFSLLHMRENWILWRFWTNWAISGLHCVLWKKF